MDQFDLFFLMDILKDGDIIDKSRIRSICSFDWLCNNIGRQVAIRHRTESNEYYVVGTIFSLTKGTWFDNCRRICVRTGKHSMSLLDEPLFFLGYSPCCHYVFVL